MKRAIVWFAAAFCLSLSAAQGIDEDETVDVSKVATKMYGRCMRHQMSSCAQLKTFYLVNDLMDLEDPYANDSSTGRSMGSVRSQQEGQINNMLFNSFFDFLSKNPLQIPVSQWFSFNNGGEFQGRRRRILRRLALPLLIGVVLKGGSIIPMILGKLTLIGTMSLIASKLSILVSALMGINKLFGKGSEYTMPAYPYPGDIYGAAPSAAGPYYRRTNVVYHKRSFDGKEQNENEENPKNEEKTLRERSLVDTEEINEEQLNATKGQRRLDEVEGKHVNIYNSRRSIHVLPNVNSL